MSDQTKPKTLETLIPDIETVLKDGAKIDDIIDEEISVLKNVLTYRLSPEARTEIGPGLRMSNLGSKCLRKLWYNTNKPETAEPLLPSARLKFLYGDILEWLMLLLAKASGHDVKGQQTELDIEGIKGHRDAIIDGTLVDVKSASKFGFIKFKQNAVPQDDPFGYMDQIGVYHHASLPELDNKTEAAFLAVEKESGNITLDKYKMAPRDWEMEVRKKKELVNSKEPPERGYSPKPHNKSGNMALDVACSYCPFKRECWPGLKAYAYSGKPVFFTEIVKEPEVPRLF